jgi:hypothetical protein
MSIGRALRGRPAGIACTTNSCIRAGLTGTGMLSFDMQFSFLRRLLIYSMMLAVPEPSARPLPARRPPSCPVSTSPTAQEDR